MGRPVSDRLLHKLGDSAGVCWHRRIRQRPVESPSDEIVSKSGDYGKILIAGIGCFQSVPWRRRFSIVLGGFAIWVYQPKWNLSIIYRPAVMQQKPHQQIARGKAITDAEHPPR